MARVLETGLGVLLVGGVALVKFGLLDDAVALARPQPDEGHMSASNPWSEDYEPKQATPQAAAPSVYYSGCNEARAAGAAPIYAGEPGYRSGMDGDGDGIACEPYYGP